MLALDDLNHAAPPQFLALIGGPLEGQTWLAERIVPQRPFANVEALLSAFYRAAQSMTEAEKITLITSHPDLAGKAAIEGSMSATSQKEQAAAGLDRLTPVEFDTFHQRNAAYKHTFGFPFVICARENTKTSILAAFESRLQNTRLEEIETGMNEVLKILQLRLLDMVRE